MTPIYIRDGTALFVAEPGRNADETLRNPLSLELYPPSSEGVGGGSLFLDDGESDPAARFILDVTTRNEGGALRIDLQRRADSFAPQQRHLELKLPPTSGTVTVDGARVALRPAAGATDGGWGRIASARIPLGALEIVCD
jgi:hypothetical protein